MALAIPSWRNVIVRATAMTPRVAPMEAPKTRDATQLIIRREILNWEIEDFSRIFPNDTPKGEEDKMPTVEEAESSLSVPDVDSPDEVPVGEKHVGDGDGPAVQCTKPDFFTLGKSTEQIVATLRTKKRRGERETILVAQFGLKNFSKEKIDCYKKSDINLVGKLLDKLGNVVLYVEEDSIDYKRLRLTFLPLAKLHQHPEIYLEDDILRCFVEITFSSETAKDFTMLPKSLQTLSDTMLDILKTGSGSDSIIICGESTLPVHTFILSARSPVFASMFSHEMQEKASSTVVIEDIEPEILQLLLEYMYTSQIGSLPSMSPDKLYLLVQVSDKYQVNELKDYCLGRLVKSMDTKNCGEIAVLAYLHSTNQALLDNIYEYCAENWFELGRMPYFQKMVRRYPDAFLQKCGPEDVEEPGSENEQNEKEENNSASNGRKRLLAP